MVAGFPPRGWYSSFLFRQQRRWRYHRRRVFSRSLLAPRCNPRVCLAASYLIRRLSTALLGAGHYRVAVCTCSSWPTASEPLEITVLFKILPRPPHLPPLFFLRLPFFSSVYSASIRYFPLARAFIALVLGIRRKSPSTRRENGRRTLAQRCYECRRNQSF